MFKTGFGNLPPGCSDADIDRAFGRPAAYEQGVEAYERGEHRDDNPYDRDRDPLEHDVWADAWLDAQERAAEAAAQGERRNGSDSREEGGTR